MTEDPGQCASAARALSSTSAGLVSDAVHLARSALGRRLRRRTARAHARPAYATTRAPCRDDGGPRPMCIGCARSFFDERGARLGRDSSRAFLARRASSTPPCASAALPAHNLTGSRCPTPLHPPFRRAVRARRSDGAGGARERPKGEGGFADFRQSQCGPASRPPARPHRENRMAPKLIASEPEGRAQRARDARGVGEFDHDRQYSARGPQG
jgi:hypothetical protein